MSTPTQTRPGQPDMQARGNVSVRSYPAPKQLATVTDLTSQEAQAVTEAVNPLIADALALYTKCKNFHWHLSGSHFRDYHLLFDKHAEDLLESVDVMAERVRRVGGTTIRSIGHISQLQTIQQEMETARQIQLSILPGEVPFIKGLEIAARYVPMTSVAGDFYDFIAIDDRRIGILVADVSGHGMPAALISSMLKIALSAQTHCAADPDVFWLA